MSWEIVAIIIGALVVLVESGVLAKLYKESKEFVDVLRQALADRRITAEELEQITGRGDACLGTDIGFAFGRCRGCRRTPPPLGLFQGEG